MNSEMTDTVRGAGGRPSRPNLVFVMADDLGWADVGCYGSPDIATPAIDSLAAEGLRLTDGYSAAAVCSPTRFALYTGRYPGRFRGGLEEPIFMPGPEIGLGPGTPTMPSRLAEAGYQTAMFGKWHCGFAPDFGPTKSGFEVFWGNHDGGMDYFTHTGMRGQRDTYEGEEPVEVDGYYTHLVTEKVEGFLDGRGGDERPFLLHVNFTSPHWPWEGPGDRAESDRIAELVRGGFPPAIVHQDGGTVAKYAEMVADLDTCVARVLEALSRNGYDDSTLVVFTSDNGGERWSHMWPLVGEKGDLTEGGVRVPLIVRFPGHIEAGQVSGFPVVTQDWTATFLDLAGVDPDPDHPLDGVSLAAWLFDRAEPPVHDLAWRTRTQGALRRGDWKLVRFGRDTETPVDRLYHFGDDAPREHANKLALAPEVAAELIAAYEAFESELLDYPERRMPPPDMPIPPGFTGPSLR